MRIEVFELSYARFAREEQIRAFLDYEPSLYRRVRGLQKLEVLCDRQGAYLLLVVDETAELLNEEGIRAEEVTKQLARSAFRPIVRTKIWRISPESFSV